LARLFRTSVKPDPVDEHGRQPGDDRYLRCRLLVLERVYPLISRLPQLRADFMGDPRRLAAADLDLGLISERFRSRVE